MKQNVGSVDRWIRVLIGLGLLSLVYSLKGDIRWIGLLGLIPLLTAAVGNCPLYSVMGLNTCATLRGRKSAD